MPLCLYPFSPEVLEKAKTQQGHFTFVLVKIDLLGFICPNLFLPVCSLSHWRRLHQPVSCASMGLTFNSLFFHPHRSQSVNQSPGSVYSAYQRSPFPPSLLSIHLSMYLPFHPSTHSSIHHLPVCLSICLLSIKPSITYLSILLVCFSDWILTDAPGPPWDISLFLLYIFNTLLLYHLTYFNATVVPVD